MTADAFNGGESRGSTSQGVKSLYEAPRGFYDEMLYTPEICAQTSIRIQVAKAAYAYEVDDNPIIDDAEFDKLAKQVDLSVKTRRPDLDKFFEEEFQPHTGSWIWNHPDFNKIGDLVNWQRQ